MLMNNTPSKRLESLDALRGFDLFFLVAFEQAIRSTHRAAGAPWLDNLMWMFRHVDWEGFSPWDLVMPLFLFMAGVSIPFSLSHHNQTEGKGKLYRRIFKRVVLLWIFGMIGQGNLLGLNPDRIYLYSNTLQAIAMGYLIASLLFLTTQLKTQAGIAAGLLVVYWAIGQFVSIDGYGGGNYTPDGNIAEWIDRAVLGRFRDAASVENGTVIFAGWYRYTWILSSLTFGVTVMTGVFAGSILKKPTLLPVKKVQWLLTIGVAMVAAGWLWHPQLPVIKKIWTSSMVLVSSGYSFILMALFYYWMDYKGHKKHLTWLKVYGMNSILAYMLAMTVDFSSIGHSVFWGLEQYIGPWYPVLITLTNVGILYGILWSLYQKKIFLRV
jgi:predicted acyltransferase